MPKRIIPVASGKGGVGKTTFAVHFALSLARFAPTILVDLDTGTSSVRSSIGASIARDLYHFHRKGEPLANCITRLDDKLDPQGRFRQFGFVAGPKQFIEEIGNPGEEFRRRLAAEINSLPADYVVLDLRAGLVRQRPRFPALHELRCPRPDAESAAGDARRLRRRARDPLPHAALRLRRRIRGLHAAGSRRGP
ncbi:MAG: P-loop NTPase [Thermoanaerobaculia bacterium]